MKLIKEQIDYRIGLPVKSYTYKGIDVDYFYHIQLVDDTHINLIFEGSYLTKHFSNKKEREQFIKEFTAEIKEVRTYGQRD